MNNENLFIVVEGTDGSGKATQVDLLTKRLVEAGHKVALFDFPRYNEPSSHFVREYLNGKYGSAEAIGPYTGSMFFSLDRYAASASIRKAFKDGCVVIANRFTGSNMAHQGTKFAHAEERRGFFIWLDNLEFQMLGIPRPTKSFVLRVPAETAQKLVDNKAKRSYTDKKRDIHEASLSHMQKSVEVYDDLCALFPKDFERVDCVRGGELMSIPQIHDLLWKSLQPMLPKVHKGQVGELVSVPADSELPNDSSLDTSQALVAKNEAGHYEVTTAGNAFLDSVVTDSEGNVYTFTDNISPITIAAAMARLSRRADDMRITILDEFASSDAKKDEKLLQRVITAYGDDSVQQLVGQHVVVEGASNLLTKKLEWGRLAAYLEQSTRYIYFDQKDKNGKYRYYVPTHFAPVVTKKYTSTLDSIFDLYSDMVHELTDYVRTESSVPKAERDVAWQGATRAQACDAARAVLPVATKSTVGIYASGQALENLIMSLLADDLPEARETGEKILQECRKVLGTFLERADKPDRGGATIAYRSNTRHKVSELTKSTLKQAHSSGKVDAVTLTDFYPKNELDIAADMLYEHTDKPLDDIREELAKLSISKKEAILTAYFGERLNRRHRPGRALEKIHYSWDLVCDYGIFRDLQRHRMVDDMEWQMLTPRLGFDTPELIEKAGLTEQFEKCFEFSLELYDYLQRKGLELEAQYATLLGHKMRWKVTYNAREAFHLHELRTTPQGHPGYRKLVLEMHEKLSEVHPMIGEAIKFVNKDEDPELTRLAAERYTQFKLNQIK